MPSISVPARMMVKPASALAGLWARAGWSVKASGGVTQSESRAIFRMRMEFSVEAAVACRRMWGDCKEGEFHFGNCGGWETHPPWFLRKDVKRKRLRVLLC